MDEKQQTLDVIEKLKEVESDLYHQLEKAEHTANILRCRKQDDIRKSQSSDTYGFCSGLMGLLFGFALGGAIASGDAVTMGFAAAGIATSATAVGLNIRSKIVCRKDMKNINNATFDVWKYYKSLKSQLEFVQLKIKSLEQIAQKDKIDIKEVEQIRTAKFEDKKSIDMDASLKEKVNKLGGSYSEADEVNLMV